MTAQLHIALMKISPALALRYEAAAMRKRADRWKADAVKLACDPLLEEQAHGMAKFLDRWANENDAQADKMERQRLDAAGRN